MIMWRLAIPDITLISCDTRIMVDCLAACSMMPYRCRSNSLSIYDSGSSSTSTSGLEIIARPSKARCNCPPESVPMGLLRLSSIPTVCRVTSIRRRSSTVIRCNGFMTLGRPIATTSSTVTGKRLSIMFFCGK